MVLVGETCEYHSRGEGYGVSLGSLIPRLSPLRRGKAWERGYPGLTPYPQSQALPDLSRESLGTRLSPGEACVNC